ncbi:DUF1934 domain-containing protein [Vagococcus vulneris]|uniref:DUF1934 domain-containing protein n=1 Tax=Vagococcus vulneris TaxID=1977869 RepID=A0A429ZXY2_9ENTE|nr:DUF1934 domain-containing protein [Vagococcus vulneris]RST98770.1 hypothetical protein CBF37_06905 [Vagococcus vulneris]
MDEKTAVPIAIKIQTKVFQNDDFSEHIIETTGQMIRIKDVLYLRYNEEMDGIQSKVPVTIKIMSDGQVQLIRSGDVRMKLRFVYQEKQETIYNTPYGMMDIATFTNNMRVSLRDKPYSGDVTIDYDLFGGSEKMGVYHMELSFTT